MARIWTPEEFAAEFGVDPRLPEQPQASAPKPRRVWTPEEFRREFGVDPTPPTPLSAYPPEIAKGVAAGAVGMVGSAVQAAGLFASGPKLDPETRRRFEQIPSMSDAEFGAFANEILRRFPPASARMLVAIASDIREGEKPDEALAQVDKPFREEGLFRTGEAIRRFGEETFPAAPGFEESLTRQISEGLGTTLAGAAISAVPGVGPPVAAATFALAGAAEQIDRAIAEGATEEQIIEAAKKGLLPGLTDSVPVETLLGRIPVPGGKLIKVPANRLGDAIRAIGRIGWQAFVEGVQEGGQQFLQNLIAREIYKPEQELGEGVLPSAGVGAGVGAIAETLFTPFRRRYSASGRPIEPGEEPAEPPAEGVRETRTRAAAERPPPPPDSPLPSDLVQEGRQIAADAIGTQEANRILERHGAPPVGTRVVAVDRSGQGTVAGTVEDVFVVRSPDGSVAEGVRLRTDEGGVVEELFDVLDRSGVRLLPEVPEAAQPQAETAVTATEPQPAEATAPTPTPDTEVQPEEATPEASGFADLVEDRRRDDTQGRVDVGRPVGDDRQEAGFVPDEEGGAEAPEAGGVLQAPGRDRAEGQAAETRASEAELTEPAQKTATEPARLTFKPGERRDLWEIEGSVDTELFSAFLEERGWKRWEKPGDRTDVRFYWDPPSSVTSDRKLARELRRTRIWFSPKQNAFIFDHRRPSEIVRLRALLENELSRLNEAFVAEDRGVPTVAPSQPETRQPATGQPQSEATLTAADIEATGADRRALERRWQERTGRNPRESRFAAKEFEEDAEAALVEHAARAVASATDVGERRRVLRELYERQPRFGTRLGQSAARQAYSTPLPIAFEAVHVGRALTTEGGSLRTVYDPTAGHGALFVGYAGAPVRIVANELDEGRARRLSRVLSAISSDSQITTGDALSVEGPKADIVLANPPFGTVRDDQGRKVTFSFGDGRTTERIDYAIAARALTRNLSDNGTAVLLLGAPIRDLADASEKARANAYRRKQQRVFFDWLYGNFDVVDHVTIDGSLYSKQGASWPIDMIVVKPKGTAAGVRALPVDVAPKPIRSFDELSDWADAVATTGKPEHEREVRPEVREGPDRGPRTDVRGRTEGVGVGAPAQERGGELAPPAAGEPGEVAGEGRESGEARGQRDAVGAGRVSGGVREDAGAAAGTGERAGERSGVRETGGPESGVGVARETDQRGAAAEGLTPDGLPSNNETLNQAKYESLSEKADGLRSIGTLTPVPLADATQQALQRLREQTGGSPANFVASELGMSREQVSAAFSAEQVDALAAAIVQAREGGAIILGDQTGIGKGRVVAGMLLWARRQGMTPVFVTERPDLYGDMWRDLTDIGVPDLLGRKPKILATNNAFEIQLDDETAIRTPPKAQHEKELTALGESGSVGDYDFVFTTYSQIQTVEKALPLRVRFLASIAPNSFFVLDESHNALGPVQSGPERRAKNAGPRRSETMREILSRARGAMYSSATYARHAALMDLYAGTDLVKAGQFVPDLDEVLHRGGIPLQQAIARDLASRGQYLRREASFEGIEYDTRTIDVDRESYARIAGALDALQTLTETVAAVLREKPDIALSGFSAIGFDNEKLGIEYSQFSSLMHNVVSQMLLAMKVPAAVRTALEVAQGGGKPVIAVSSTLETQIAYLAGREGIPADFGAVLHRYLERALEVTVKTGGDTKERVRHDPDRNPEIGAAYEAAKRAVESLDLSGLPLSPIDAITHELERNGLRVGELTGRSLRIDYSGREPKIVERPASESTPAAKRRVVDAFNRGDLDVVILNRSGASGLSLHASERFADQRQRVMIVAQASDQIDTHVQILGRVNRTGQVVKPRYVHLVADVPAEVRPTAVLLKKLAQLNANTKATRKDLFERSDVDFYNEAGEKAVRRALAAVPNLGKRLRVDPEDKDAGDLLRKTLGRLSLASFEEQQAFLDAMDREYRSILAEDEELASRIGDMRVARANARVIEEIEWKPEEPGNVFGRPVVAQLVEGHFPERATPDYEQTLDIVRRATEKRDPGVEREQIRRARSIVRKLPYRQYVRADVTIDRIVRFVDRFRPGTPVSLRVGDAAAIFGVVEEVGISPKSATPNRPSEWHLTVRVADPRKILRIPLSRIEAVASRESEEQADDTARWTVETADEADVRAAFAESSSGNARLVVFTGNILRAASDLVVPGSPRWSVAFLEYADGRREPAIITERSSFDEFARSVPFAFDSADDAASMLREGIVDRVEGARDEFVLSVEPSGSYRLGLKAPAVGRKLHTSQRLKDTLADPDFVITGKEAAARVKPERLEDALQIIAQAFNGRLRIVARGQAAVRAREAQKARSTGAKFSRFARPSRKVVRSRQELGRLLRKELDQTGLLGKVHLRFFDRLERWMGENSDDIDGYQLGNVIGVSVHAEDPVGVISHETIHALRDPLLWERPYGLFTREEWEALQRHVEADEDLIAEVRHRYPDLDPELLTEEAVAVAYARWRTGKREIDGGFVRRAFRKMTAFFEALRNAFRGAGFRSAEDIFDDVAAGRIGRRAWADGTEARIDLHGPAGIGGNMRDLSRRRDMRFARRRTGPRPDGSFRWQTPGVEDRWQPATRGLRIARSVIEAVRDWTGELVRGFTRRWRDLPNTPFFAEAQVELRKLLAAPEAAREQIVRDLQALVGDMNSAELDLFTRKVVMDDLLWTASQGMKIPFGLDENTVRIEHARVSAEIAKFPYLVDRVRQRKLLVSRLTDEMVREGVLSRDQANNPAYYRHQVLVYAQEQVRHYANKVRKPRWVRRLGSTLDINANLLEAEFEWMYKARVDIAKARLLRWLAGSKYNRTAEVKQAVRDRNMALLSKAIASDPAVAAQWNDAKKAIARAVGGIRRPMEEALDDMPDHLRERANAFLSSPDPESEPIPFDVAAWMVANGNDRQIAAAAGLFKAVNERKALLKKVLGDEWIDPLDLNRAVKAGLAPEDHVVWDPYGGRFFVTAHSIPEHVLQRMETRLAGTLGSMVPADEVQRMLDAVRDMRALARPPGQIVIPKELAATLENVFDPIEEDLYGLILERPLSLWKQWVLFSPNRVLRYTLNNLSGDLDAVIAGNPRALTRMNEAIREIYNVMYRGRQPSARYREAVERGIFDAGITLHEIPDINELDPFVHLFDKPRGPFRRTGRQILRIWRAIHKFNSFREAWLRYAAYLDYVERLERGEPLEKVGFGASNPDFVRAVPDPKDKAALLARELIGDYGMVSSFGRRLRRTTIPFYSWLEVNTRRYNRLIANAVKLGVARGGLAAGVVGIGITAKLAVRIALMYTLVKLFNNLFFPEEEDELSQIERTRPHIIVGRSENGEILLVRFQGALSDYLAWIGWEDAVDTVSMIEDGQASYGDLVNVMAKAPVNKVVSGLTPVVTVPLRMLGLNLWPDVFNPRPVRDPWREVARAVALEREYDLLLGKPTRGPQEFIERPLLTRLDVGEQAYNNIRSLAARWIRDRRGTEGFSTLTTPRSNLIYEWRLARKFGDREAEKRIRARMRELGMTQADIVRSVKRAHPLALVPIKDRKAFLDFLTPKQRAEMRKAIKWYENTFFDRPEAR